MHIMYTINKTNEFSDWLSALRDIRARARIVNRIKSAEQGNFGDCEPVGEGVSEMRVHIGAGYRVYQARKRGLPAAVWRRQVHPKAGHRSRQSHMPAT